MPALRPSVVQVANLEAAELIKLANNTFRDLSFAFSNELALYSDAYNLDAFALIGAANQGYPRNPKPDTSQPYVMWGGTPYEHLMIPIR